MNLLSVLTPDQATSNFNAWLAAGVGMITGLCLAAAVVLPKIAALAAQVKTLFGLHDTNSAAITTLALHTPPPALASVADTALAANTAATQENTAAVEQVLATPSAQ